MSKPLTALLMIRLQEQGKLQFDDPIEKFLPQFADLQVLDVDSEIERLKRAQSKVTIRLLDSHIWLYDQYGVSNKQSCGRRLQTTTRYDAQQLPTVC